MNLNVTSPINTSTGTQVTGAVGYITAHTQNLINTGIVPCDLQFYVNAAASTNNMDNFIPVVLNTNGTIKSRVGGISITLTAQQAAAANLPLTIFQQVAAALTSTYGWTVTVTTP